jgi:hypothetical protein
MEDCTLEFENDRGKENFESACAEFICHVAGTLNRSSSLSGAKLETEMSGMAFLQFVRG